MVTLAQNHFDCIFRFFFTILFTVSVCVGGVVPRLRSKFMAILGWSVARWIKFFLSKSIKREFAIKSRDLRRVYSNFDTAPILIVKICWKSQNFQIWTPTKKNLNFFSISPIFGPKFPNRDLLIFFHTRNFLTFNIYIVAHLTKFHGCR